MNDFKDIFAKWEQEHKDFDYAKTLVDKNEDEDSRNEQLSSQKMNIIITKQNNLRRFALQSNQIRAHKQIVKLRESQTNLFNFIKDYIESIVE